MSSSTWPVDESLTDTTTPGQSEPGSNGNEGILHITGASSSDGV